MTNSLSKKYEDLCSESSDINEHLPTLRKYAQQCKHITEMGVRTIVSTYALMAGSPNHLISIDINHPDDSSNTPGKLQEAQTIASDNNVNFQFIQGNTLEMSINCTDLLFIDTWHTYDQLKQELSKHHQNVNKYIILHDTYTYSNSDEGGGGIGLMPAVNEFLDVNKNWTMHEQFSNNNGLTILAKQ